MGITMDGKLHNKHWIIVGNITSNLDSIKLPYFKVGLWGNFRLVNFHESIIGNINDKWGEKLRYENVTAPVRYEKALQAHHGVEEWKETYNSLLFDDYYASYEEMKTGNEKK